MITTPTGDECGPNEAISALDIDGLKALRDQLLDIQKASGGEAAVLAGAKQAEIEQAKQAKQVEQAKQAKQVEQAKQAKQVEQAKQALQEFRDYLGQSRGVATHALPNNDELVYAINPDTQKCEITRIDGAPIVLDISASGLTGSLPLPHQLMIARLECSNNYLTALPELPASLTELRCTQNLLKKLPELPDSLTLLWCAINQLIALPELPASLTMLWCYGNQLDLSDPATHAALQQLIDRGATVSA